MSISLHTLRRGVALVVACLLGSAATFLAVSQGTHQPVQALVRAVFTPSADALAPWSAPAPVAQPPSPTGVIIFDPANPMSYSSTGVRVVHCPAVVSAAAAARNVCITLPGDDMMVTPELLTGAMLPPGAVIRVRTASGTVENCTHSTGSGISTTGLVATGDGWKCARLTPPKFVPRTSGRDQ